MKTRSYGSQKSEQLKILFHLKRMKIKKESKILFNNLKIIIFKRIEFIKLSNFKIINENVDLDRLSYI